MNAEPPCPRIEDYALIGDCETAALVGRDGSIDWLCWPRFDSDACFAALLGTPENGRWIIGPAGGGVPSRRSYRGETLILETRFETQDAAVTLIDFMPPRGVASDIVRVVRGERGTMRMQMSLTLRFGYGSVTPWVSRLDDGTMRAVAGPDMTVLRSPVEFHGEKMATVSEFEVSAGESFPFVLTYGASHLPLPSPIDPEAALADTETFWREWSDRFQLKGLTGQAEHPPHWLASVKRSLLTLKALTYAPTGGIVAAPTTSLPEQIGGERNWDYRYCWLRDSAITLFALMNSGYYDEAESWRDWLIRAAAGSTERLQIMYGLSGERRLPEWSIDWLPGFAGSSPVRVGNGAHQQLQLDVYGEVCALLHAARVGGMAEDERAWALQKSMLAHLEEVWREPDEGIWETRAGPQPFTYSKVMAWVAFDRAIHSAEMFGLDGAPLDRWRALREEIHQDVCAKGFDAARNTFTQVYGGRELDASLLLIPLFDFLPADDPRIVGTIAAVEGSLLENGLVLRYRTEQVSDGLDPGEGAFLACSFWLVSAYLKIGRLDDARAMYERLLELQNDVGLLAEEADPKTGRHLGNFPQAFSHVALAVTGHRLLQALAEGETTIGR